MIQYEINNDNFKIETFGKVCWLYNYIVFEADLKYHKCNIIDDNNNFLIWYKCNNIPEFKYKKELQSLGTIILSIIVYQFKFNIDITDMNEVNKIYMKLLKNKFITKFEINTDLTKYIPVTQKIKLQYETKTIKVHYISPEFNPKSLSKLCMLYDLIILHSETTIMTERVKFRIPDETVTPEEYYDVLVYKITGQIPPNYKYANELTALTLILDKIMFKYYKYNLQYTDMKYLNSIYMELRQNNDIPQITENITCITATQQSYIWQI